MRLDLCCCHPWQFLHAGPELLKAIGSLLLSPLAVVACQARAVEGDWSSVVVALGSCCMPGHRYCRLLYFCYDGPWRDYLRLSATGQQG